jgi:hypothetical protein
MTSTAERQATNMDSGSFDPLTDLDGIPWYLTVDLDTARERASVELFKLEDGRYHRAALAHAGSRFAMTDPFAAGFDPIELLMR